MPMTQSPRIPLEQTINGTTIHINFSDTPPGSGMEQIRSILLSSCELSRSDLEKGVDKHEAA